MSLELNFQQQLAQQVRHELALRIHSQPQVDAETWQFQGDSSEWVSFPASLTVLSTFGTYYSFP